MLLSESRQVLIGGGVVVDGGGNADGSTEASFGDIWIPRGVPGA